MAKSILVIQTAFLGDIVLSTSFLRTLRKQNPQSKIYFLTTPVGVEILQGNPWNLELLSFDKRGSERGVTALWAKIRHLRTLNIEVVYCLHRYFRSSLIAYATGAKKIVGFSEAAGAFFYSERISRADFTYEAEKIHALLGEKFSSDSLARSLYPELVLDAEETRLAQELLNGFTGPYLALSPSSVWATKRWPVERYAELAIWAWRNEGLRTLIVAGGTDADRTLASALKDAYDKHRKDGEPELLDLAGKTSLAALKGILAGARVTVGNDSAPLHVANSLGGSVLGIYGPTTRELGFFPISNQNLADTVEIELSCRPCGDHGHDRCPQEHFRCMLDLDLAMVQKKLKGLLCRESKI